MLETIQFILAVVLVVLTFKSHSNTKKLLKELNEKQARIEELEATL